MKREYKSYEDAINDIDKLIYRASDNKKDYYYIVTNLIKSIDSDGNLNIYVEYEKTIF